MLTRENCVSKIFYFWTIEVKNNSVKDTNCWFYYLKMFWKFQILKKLLKRAKTLKNLKKTVNFFLFRRFYTGRKNFTNKKGLFYAKFFEFEEFSIVPFFCSSIQPQHTVFYHASAQFSSFCLPCNSKQLRSISSVPFPF